MDCDTELQYCINVKFPWHDHCVNDMKMPLFLKPDMKQRAAMANGEQCQICGLWRFNFGTRDQAWSLKSFCVAELY